MFGMTARVISANAKLVALTGLVTVVSGCNLFDESIYSNCVVTEHRFAYTGEMLMYEGDARQEVRMTMACIAEDEDVDGGDGPVSGRVRWVVCEEGADCSMTGMF